MQFQKAERKRSWLKLAITGPSGSGKTYSALRLAFGLGKRIALIDTENGSASLYAQLGEYDTLEIGPPFTPERYRQAIQAAVAGGYDVLIVDSLSHAWAGEGGLLQEKEGLDARGGNSFTNWASITKKHEAFKASLLQAPIHTIATMRSKTEYVVDQSDGRKATPRKIGMAPIQRDGMEYEFSAVLDIAADHTAIASKDRTGLFAGLNGLVTEDHGRAIARWLEGGATMGETAQPAPTTAAPPPTSNLPSEPESPMDPWGEDDRDTLIRRYGEVKAKTQKLGGKVEKLLPTMSNDDIGGLLLVAEATLAGLESQETAGATP